MKLSNKFDFASGYKLISGMSGLIVLVGTAIGLNIVDADVKFILDNFNEVGAASAIFFTAIAGNYGAIIKRLKTIGLIKNKDDKAGA